MIEAAGPSAHVDVEVDGGIGPKTVAAAAAAGANVVVGQLGGVPAIRRACATP